MNKARRAHIKEICGQLKALSEDLGGILDEEQDSFDSIPENLQDSERAQESEDAIDNIDDAIVSLEEAIDSLRDVI